MITTVEALKDFVVLLRQATRVALDTEADSMHCYFEKLCLVQISIPGHNPVRHPPPASLRGTAAA